MIESNNAECSETGLIVGVVGFRGKTEGDSVKTKSDGGGGGGGGGGDDDTDCMDVTLACVFSLLV